ncbi:MAG: bifunctional hydroxymethylpyrimidine kinase/phosphomethylpyrimidine kinase [Planctomycetaceae bacterium]
MAKKTSTSGKPKSIRIFPDATALTIAGSDPSGGAGLQADLKTFQHLGVYGMSVITLLTVQNTQGVTRVEVMSPKLICDQLDAVLSDIPPQAIKIGALGNANVVRAVAERLKTVSCPIVVDPVLVSKHGDMLVTDDVVKAYNSHLLPLAFLVTPNRFEAERLTGLTLDCDEAIAKAMFRLGHSGARHVLIKLGEVNGHSHHCLNGHDFNDLLETPRFTSINTHGTGCILSAAITANLAQGETHVKSAVLFGIHRVYEAIALNTKLGKGIHPAEIRGMARE